MKTTSINKKKSQKAIDIPRTLSKKQLTYIFAVDDTPISYYILREHFFPDEILEKLGMTIEKYKKKRVFPAHTTRKIIEIHQLLADDFECLY